MTHWHGFTAMADRRPIRIERAEGCHLYTSGGDVLIDGVSNLWCNVHGHRRPEIDAAVRDQLERVAHVTTLGMAADTTDVLADRLAAVTPGDLRHTFFSSDGSAAVEAACKMAFQYQRQRPDPRPDKRQFLALGSAYHGDTTGSVSLGGIEHFHRLFKPILFDAVRGPTPCTYRLPANVDIGGALENYATELETLIEDHADGLVAVIMEPLVQGAAGMITHPPGLLRRVRGACDRHDVLLILDEVATGFGRTGRMFACDHEDVTPDILCLGKGLTGGYLPMAATVARPRIFEAFLGDAPENRQFFHGHTFGGNPLAAAAALASLDLFESDDTVARVDCVAGRLRDGIRPLDDHPNVGDIRGRGLMFGVEIVEDREAKRPFASERQIGRRICEAAIDRGLWIRPLGDVLVLMPPPVIDDETLDRMSGVVVEAVQSTLGSNR